MNEKTLEINHQSIDRSINQINETYELYAETCVYPGEQE
jgi:hypothetical protein